MSLKDIECSVDLYSRLGIQIVVACSEAWHIEWFRHLKQKSVNDWVSASRNVVERVRMM